MKPPLSPPPLHALLQGHHDRLAGILAADAYTALPRGRYHHWDKLRHLPPPDGLNAEQWWLGVKMARGALYRQTPLSTPSGSPFVYALPDPVLEALHRIDQRAAGRLVASEPVVNAETRDRYILNSLMEEAITSSQLEGAATTRQVAADMIRAGRGPRNRDERMILNNFRAMASIRELRNEPLSVERIVELHRALTEETLSSPEMAGQLQTAGMKRVAVSDNTTGRVVHIPPPAEQLPARMERMVAFANGAALEGEGFTHPLVRAIILHFWLAYDHPFEDGNGRTARALFYWSMLRQGYWLFEFISLSSIIRRAPVRYARAFLETETDGNDLTYFILHQLDCIDRALVALDDYLARKTAELRGVEERLARRNDLNPRQLALLGHALRHPEHVYTIRSHQTSHGVAYATARADLLELAELGLLEPGRRGRAYVYHVPRDLEARLRAT